MGFLVVALSFSCPCVWLAGMKAFLRGMITIYGSNRLYLAMFLQCSSNIFVIEWVSNSFSGSVLEIITAWNNCYCCFAWIIKNEAYTLLSGEFFLMHFGSDCLHCCWLFSFCWVNCIGDSIQGVCQLGTCVSGAHHFGSCYWHKLNCNFSSQWHVESIILCLCWYAVRESMISPNGVNVGLSSRIPLGISWLSYDAISCFWLDWCNPFHYYNRMIGTFGLITKVDYSRSSKVNVEV